MYCAIISDIIDSKKITNRKSVQNMLNETLTELNSKYINEIASKFTITLGDEFQVLLNSPSSVLEILDYISSELNTVKMRFGIGLGVITTEINPNLAIGADGPAYHFARLAVNQIKEFEKKKEMPLSDTIINIGIDGTFLGNNKSMSIIINTINNNLALCTFIKSKWTNKQIKVIENISLGHSQMETANLLGVNQSVITRMLSASGYYNYIYARDSAQKAINYLWEALNEQ